MDNTQEVKNDYDSEPVKFCARCYSLKVKSDDDSELEYCADCGCTDIQEAPIEEWEEKYEGRYGHKFTKKNEDPKKSFIFKLPLAKLKTRVYQNTRWRDIIKSIYPNFPGGYSRIDSVLLFFDTLIKQNRLEELRLLLLKHFKN